MDNERYIKPKVVKSRMELQFITTIKTVELSQETRPEDVYRG